MGPVGTGDWGLGLGLDNKYLGFVTVMSELEVVSGVVSTVTHCVQKASHPGYCVLRPELMRPGHVT